MMRRAIVTAIACALAGPAFAQAAFDTVLKPVRQGDEVSAIDVVSRVRGGPVGRPFSLRAAVVYAGQPGVADRVTDLVVRDAKGPVRLSVVNDPANPGGFPYYRHWRATRAVTYPVTYSYRALAAPAAGPQGPAFLIRASGGGISGSGGGFLALPENLGRADISLRWDTSALGDDAIGVSSFGEGAVTLKAAWPERLVDSWYMAGPVGRYEEAGLHGFWLGRARFDPVAALRWTGKARAYLSEIFGYMKQPADYRVFMRFLEAPPYGGGTALANSFMLSGRGGETNPASPGPRHIFVHEMVHQWIGSISAPDSSWFTEGLTEFTTGHLMNQGGFTTIDEYGAWINSNATGYWGAPAYRMSAADIIKVGFGDELTRQVPYRRGVLYFANLDAQIRAHSGGKRRLGPVLRDVFLRRQAGEQITLAKWTEVVTREAGAEAGRQVQAYLVRGEPVEVASNAFGPCFARRPMTYKQTSGVQVEGYQWARVAGVPEAQCRKW